MELTQIWKESQKLREEVARWLGFRLVEREEWEESCCDPRVGYRYNYFVLENGDPIVRYDNDINAVNDIVSTRLNETQRAQFFAFLERLIKERKYHETAFPVQFQHFEALCRVMDIGKWDQELTWEI